jgi:hypothetical protein
MQLRIDIVLTQKPNEAEQMEKQQTRSELLPFAVK